MKKKAETKKVPIIWKIGKVQIPAEIKQKVLESATSNKRTYLGELSAIICKAFGVDYDTINPSKRVKASPWSRPDREA